MTRRPLTVHAYVHDGVTDHRGTSYCAAAGCGLPERHPRHTLPAPDPDQAALTARMLGDRDED